MEGFALPFFILTYEEKLLSLVTFNFGSLVAQSSSYWQQQVDYKMDVVMDVKTTNTKAHKN
jgi:hypothetical protein